MPSLRPGRLLQAAACGAVDARAGLAQRVRANARSVPVPVLLRGIVSVPLEDEPRDERRLSSSGPQISRKRVPGGILGSAAGARPTRPQRPLGKSPSNTGKAQGEERRPGKPNAKENAAFTNRFQNLLSFSFDDAGGDGDATDRQAGKSPSQPPAQQQRNAGRARSLLDSADGVKQREASAARAPPSAASAKPRIREATKRPQRKKAGLGLLETLNFEERLFGNGSEFFSPIDWNAFDADVRRTKRPQKPMASKPKEPAPPRRVDVPARISIRELSERMRIRPSDLLLTLQELGEGDLHEDSMLSSDIAEVAVEALDMVPVLQSSNVIDVKLTIPPSDCSMFPRRPPVVAVMGHVDHGKTTLLDALRSCNVAATEAGGITQTLCAFPVPLGKSASQEVEVLTCLDTPGHAAFRAMRSTGSQVTDMIVLVIAAEAGVQSQTREAVALAQERNVSLVVAITKIDQYDNERQDVVERIAKQLLELGVAVEAMGGDTPLVCVSGKTGEGLDQLKETLALHAEMMELRADIAARGEAIVLEAQIKRNEGVLVDAVVHWGSLQVGDVVVCGHEYGRVRALVDANGKRLKRALPGVPVRVMGLRGVPAAADSMITVESEEEAKEIVEQRKMTAEWEVLGAARLAKVQADDKRKKADAIKTAKARQEARARKREEGFEGEDDDDDDDEDAERAMLIRKRKAMKSQRHKSRELELRRQEAEAEAKRVASLKVGDEGYVAKPVPIVVKTNALGMLAAIDELIATLPSDEAVIKRVGGGVGPISPSDLEMAETANATIFEFGVKHTASIADQARQLNVPIRHHSIVYALLDDISTLLQSHLSGVQETEVVGAAEIVQDIALNQGRRTSHVAGCRVTMGVLSQHAKFRLLREGQIICADVTVQSMRHFQDKVSEVRKGQECGLALVFPAPEVTKDAAAGATAPPAADGAAGAAAAAAAISFQVGDVLEAYRIQDVKKN